MLNKIIIFTDGASKGNPGPGGFGVVIINGEKVLEFGGGETHTTNNRMELSGAIKALEKIEDIEKEIVIYTDSKYLIGGMTEWVSNWQKNNWRTAQKKEVLNRDLWERLINLAMGRKINWLYVAGHNGNPGNERCDEIASAFALGENANLYTGPIDKYPIKLADISLNEQ